LARSNVLCSVGLRTNSSPSKSSQTGTAVQRQVVSTHGCTTSADSEKSPFEMPRSSSRCRGRPNTRSS
jgi:hypothetical protein